MATFFVTGGCGFIGQWLARRLVDEGNDVTLYDVKTDRSIVGDSTRMKVVKGRTDDSEGLASALRSSRPETVVHYAALLSATAEENPQAAYEVNVASLWPLLNAARSADVASVLFPSTAAVYGPGTGRAREDGYHIPSTIYGVSKMYGEMMGAWFSRTYDIGFAAFRYASVIGPGRGEGGASAFTSLIIQKAAEGKPYTVMVPERAAMPLVYVKDAVDATLFVHRRIRSLGVEDPIFNVAGITPGPTARELASLVRKKVPGAAIDFRPDARMSKIVDSWSTDHDTERLRRLGWRPSYGDLDGLVDDFVREVRTGRSG